jgi:hypothetical protein
MPYPLHSATVKAFSTSHTSPSSRLGFELIVEIILPWENGDSSPLPTFLDSAVTLEQFDGRPFDTACAPIAFSMLYGLPDMP